MSEQIPVIELESYRITNVDFKVYNSLEDIEQKNITHGEISASVGVTEDTELALLKLRTTVIDDENLRVISVEIAGQFTINEKENYQHHLQVNGTAILMPYLRMIVSILSSLDNESSIILPTLNTHNFKNVEDDSLNQ